MAPRTRAGSAPTPPWEPRWRSPGRWPLRPGRRCGSGSPRRVSRRRCLCRISTCSTAACTPPTCWTSRSSWSPRSARPSHPPKKAISKTALGAEERAPWEHAWDPLPLVEALRARNYEIAAVETSVHAVDLFDWKPRFPVCLVFGHEVEGIRPQIAERCDTHVRIPMLGIKHSLNVATAGGVAIYELLRKYREMQRP